MLQDLVDRQLDRLPVGRWGADPADDVLLGVNLDDHVAGLPRNPPVVRRLDPAQPLAVGFVPLVGPDVAEHVRGQLVVWIGALRVRAEVDAGELEEIDTLLDAGLLRRRHLPLDVGEMQ